MDPESYFGMILTILIGITFIVLVFAFLYLVYGEKEEGISSSKTEILKGVFPKISAKAFRFSALF